MSGDGIPVLLTVEEAGELLRIGRTKAYAMAREWRETDGRSGLPVIDLGHVLRVPRQALEELVGADLSHLSGQRRGDEAPAAVPPTESEHPPTSESEVTPVNPLVTRRTPRRKSHIANQLDLFNSESTSS
ncbi:MAG TPA: helix-turn-helix domain-containing protein [Acidimicrobiia bacterium]|nr:helix-turn-helix domain-containing protein [Acidimicrobiia bacterium]